MRFQRAYLKTFIGDGDFYKQALMVMIPIIIQQLINTLFNVADNFMVGQLDGISMSAVTVANKPALIYNGFFFGVTGAGGLMLSQYFGAQEYKKCQSLFALQMLLGFVIAALFCAAMLAFPRQIMHIFVNDQRTVSIGVDYLRIVAYSYLPAAITTTCIFSMRALGYTKEPMLISIVAILLNVFFNYALIFGHFGMPRMGVEGAALGTLLSRLIEMAFYIIILLKRSTLFSFDLLSVRTLKKPILKSFVKRAMPLTVNEILWTTGLAIYFWSYARIDEAALPAITIADLVVQIGFIISMGMASAISVLIGTRLGAGEFDEARTNAKKLFGLSCFNATVSTAIALSMSFWLPQIFNVEPHLQALGRQLAWVGALFYLPNAMYAFCFFCLRAGGDTRHAAMLDSGYMWVLPVPVAVLLGLFGQGRVSIIWAMLIVQLLMNAKVIVALKVVLKGKWIRNITQEA